MNKQRRITGRERSVAVSMIDSDSRSTGLHCLLQNCIQTCHDELLWAEFVHRSQPVIAAAAIKTIRRWVTPTLSLVEDLIQETYLKLFADNAQALRRFVCHEENALYGFLKVVACNVVHDHFRCIYSQKRGGGRQDETIDHAELASKIEGADRIITRRRRSGKVITTEVNLLDDLHRRIMLQQIDACLRNQFSETSRDYTIFWLHYGKGLTAKAISCVPSIGLSVKGVESALLRLNRLVRVKMASRALQQDLPL